jgi:hypothetical protein
MHTRRRDPMTRRTFAKLWSAAAGAAAALPLIAADDAATRPDAKPTAPAAGEEKLQSELLFDLVFERGAANDVGSPGVRRVIVPVPGGTFEGPKLKGTVSGPSGDWIVGRPDGSSVLDLRLLLQTDDAQKIYMASRGIAYTPPGGTLNARIQTLFETGAAKYAWLNDVVAVGVDRPVPGKVAYRIYRIL